MVEVQQGSDAYLRWLRTSTSLDGEPEPPAEVLSREPLPGESQTSD